MICNVCNKRRVQTGSKGTEVAPHGSDMCNYCYEEGSWENSHQDEGHNEPTIATPELTDGCWICHPELNLAQKATRTSTGSRVQGTRRPQLNHKGHSHPQTPAARRACKNAFWAEMAKPGYADEVGLWDYACDANGKAIEVRPATWNVQPKAKNNKVNMKAVGEEVKRTRRRSK